MSRTIACLYLLAFGTFCGEGPAPKVEARPQPVYRVWFQPNLIRVAPELYSHMTMDAGGTVDPALLEKPGQARLGWAYGINLPDPTGPKYWADICTPTYRTFPRRGAKPGDSIYILAGIALDEWTHSANPQTEQWAAEGLRQGRKNNPGVFIAVWITDLTDTLAALVKDGTVDLLIIEDYTHAPARLGKGPFAMNWNNALRRCEQARKAGVLENTIVCMGHITDEADLKEHTLSAEKLEALAKEIKQTYPQMPGIAFYQATKHDTPELRKLVEFCNTLSVKYLPDTK